MTRPLNTVSRALAVLAVAAALCPAAAKAWWNDEWQLRKKITIDASATGGNITDPIGTTPVLIRLYTGNFRFQAAKDDGSDLRFISSDDKTPLKHHFEKYDSLLGEALVWVQVPNLAPGAKTDIWLYAGNKKAVATADARGTYDSDSRAVYHFGERGTPALDSSQYGNNAQSVGQPADGALIGTGLRLGTEPLALPAAPSLALAADGGFTWSAWVKPAALQPNAAIYTRRDPAAGNAIAIGLDNGVPFVEVTTAGTAQRTGAAAPITAATWHHLAVTTGQGKVTLYLDGDPYAALTVAVPALNTYALVGGDTAVPAAAPAAPAAPADGGAAAPAEGGAAPAAPPADAAAAAAPAAAATAALLPFNGDVDELQISAVARPAGFIRFATMAQGLDKDRLISFSIDEETASWLSGYFAVILKSVTLDGWVVIGLLMLMALISWIVMFDRAGYLGRQAKANTRFMSRFRQVDDVFAPLDSHDAQAVATLGGRLTARDLRRVRASSLYHIYQLGMAEIMRRYRRDGGRPQNLSATTVSAIRAVLDSGLIRETQRLNRLMVILTIAISGGPFLGLLGTVIGVMITFAAIAASGDVNVNAIAPGIAAALVATVAGLGVAIPALFGYNYLVSRIRNLTIDIQVFVDEFVTRMAEAYSSDRPDPADQRIAAE